MKLSEQLLNKCGINNQINESNEWDNAEYVGVFEDWNEDTEEPGELGVLTITKNDDYIFAGSMTNSGMSHSYKMEINKDFSIDENLENFISALNTDPGALSESITIKISDTNNQAFVDDKDAETARILRELADSIANRGIESKKLYDVNGNVVGQVIDESKNNKFLKCSKQQNQ